MCTVTIYMNVLLLLIFVIGCLCLWFRRNKNKEPYIAYPTYPRVQQYLQAGMDYDDHVLRDVNYLPICAISSPASEQCVAAKMYETGDSKYANDYCSKLMTISEACMGNRILRL